ncbi:MAG: peptidase S8 [Deltaproteobacteria bacterium]|nr:peptidase S8 [Deltaproteobacteria bacterium]
MKRFAIVSCAILAVMSLAATASAVPPHKAGEVAVYGTPDTLTDYQVVKHLPWANLTVIKVESGREWGHIQKLRQKGRVAGYNLIANKSTVPNDSYFGYQWHMTAVQAEQAWDITTGNGVVVAVVDTGLATGGPDGIGCVVAGYDVVNGDSDPFDGSGHGTHVSGTIAQTTNNGNGVAGLAYGACIMPIKVLSDSGSGSFADIAEGIYYAVDNGAQVINMSLGVAAPYEMTNDSIVDPALDYAYANGVTVVVAAGNDGYSKMVGYPAIYPTTIAVGSVDFDNVEAVYSNSGIGLDIMAPGGDTSEDLNGDGYVDGILQETLVSGAWGYHFYQGTSMASPHVAAGAALLIASGTAVTPDEVYEALTGSALDLGDAGVDSDYAHGLMQVYDALNYGEAPLVCVADGECNAECAEGVDPDCVVEPPPIVCGDGTCDASEDCSSCPDDCGVCPFCGDGTCDAGEDCSSCSDDCGVCSFCGDGTCDANEDCSSCSDDCGVCSFCGDGTCDANEDCSSCSDDCGECACSVRGVRCSSNDECCSGSCHRRKLTCK